MEENSTDNKKISSKYALVWVDLEMTGLIDDYHTIIEMAVIITDGDLNVVGDGGMEMVINASEEELQKMSKYVQEMHEKNGLTKKVRESKITLEQAEKKFVKYLKVKKTKNWKKKSQKIKQKKKDNIGLKISFLF